MACPYCGTHADWYKLDDSRSRCPNCYATTDDGSKASAGQRARRERSLVASGGEGCGQTGASPMRTYTTEVSADFAKQYDDWRPITDLADEIKVVTHTDGTADLFFRATPLTNVVHLHPNGTGKTK